MEQPTISVLYSCVECGLQDISVAVRARADEDVVLWLRRSLAPEVAADHCRRSPFCKARAMSAVKVPLTGTSKVGGPVEN